MSRNLIATLVLLAVTHHARSQYLDFFQSLNTFIQPYQTTRRSDVATKRPTNKRIQDAIFFETDQFMTQRQASTIDPFSTSKPKRKPKTTRPPSTRPWYLSNDMNKNEKTTNENGNNYNNYNNNLYNYDNNVALQTERPYSNINGAQKPTSQTIYSRRTTMNPLLHRPGVRPAVVDDGRPPITNRPVTNRPFLNPVAPNRPVTNEYESPKIETGLNEDEMSEAEKRRFIEMAEQKCDEYTSLNTKKIVALPLATIHLTQGVELNVSTCTPITIPLIIGGKPSSIKEFPHMSLVGWKNIQKVGYSWKCGGSLISDQFILTAGHCTYHDKDYNVVSGPPAAVQLGSSYIDGQDSLVVSISSVIRHPKYKARRSYYDVALIKLTSTVTFSESISPACLGVPPPIGDSIIATGWGRTEFGGDASKDLRSVAVSVWRMDECRAVWGTSRKMPEGPSSASQLCAGVRQGGKDTCQGDSGGPVQVQDGCKWRVVGVTSVGRSCGAVDTPALYARLPRAFIASQVFTNVKLNNQNNVNNNGNNNGNKYNDSNDDRFNENNNDNRYNGNNNWSNDGFNQGDNQSSDRDKRPGNHQSIGNNWGVTSSNSNNQFSGTSGSNREFIRPGNHQTINNQGTVTNTQFTSQNKDENAYRPGNHQIIDNTKIIDSYYGNSNAGNNRDEINRPGNHQTIDTNKRGNDAINYFVTSHTSGNNRDVTRLGNHQTVDNNRATDTGNNFFVTSHTSSNNRERVVRLPGNHQTIANNNNNNRFADSQNSESNHDTVYDLRQLHDNKNTNANQDGTLNINYDNARTTDYTNNGRANNQYNNGNSYYNNEQYNNSQNTRTSKTYSNFGAQNPDGTTESVSYNGYNDNNNGYYGNNNRGYIVTNRPWWNR